MSHRNCRSGRSARPGRESRPGTGLLRDRLEGRAGIAEDGTLKSNDPLKQKNEVLRDRICKLSAASLRISASLDLDTILSEVVDSA